MKLMKPVLAVAALVSLTGCGIMGETASFSEAMQDNLIFSSAKYVDEAQKNCVLLTKSFTFKSGAVTYSLPAGKYVGRRKHQSGVFYYAPRAIKSSNHFWAFDQEGIYLANHANHGNVFSRKAMGYDDRPIRGAVLPTGIFKLIKRKVKC